MPFGLKNAGSTYQRMMTRMFEPQLGRNIEIYIDDMVVKSKIVAEHVKDLESTFEVLREYKLRLNASKCSFGMGSGKFLGYMVTHRGIEVNSDQIKAHTVIVLTQLPLKAILRSADYTGRIAKWGTILRAFDIKYMPRTSVKGQILADLVAKFTEPRLEEAIPTSDMDGKSVGMISQQSPSYWEMYVDGTANQNGSGIGLVLVSPEKIVIEKSLKLNFTATNNEAEYEALLTGMDMVQRMGGNHWKRSRTRDWLNGNTHADSLATLATSSVQSLPRIILVEDLQEATEAGTEAVQVHQIRAEPSWMDPIINFLRYDVLPKEKGEADKVQRKATRFWLSEDQRLYKRSYTGPYLLCIHPEAAELLLEELHEGICGSHTGVDLWLIEPLHKPGGTLNPLSSLWPFAQWGLDIVGPFPKAAGNKKYLLVGTDYFTKWVEAEALANIRDVDV
nr:uncharacterized protein LOC112028471 [Quercus suber]